MGGLDSCLTLAESLSTDVFRALVWLAKSLLASLTTMFASACTFATADSRALVPFFLISSMLGMALTEASRLLKAAQ